MQLEQLVPVNPFFSNLLVIIVIVGLFSLGIWVKSVFDQNGESLNAKQIIASTIAAFFLLGLPLAQITHDAMLGATNLFVLLTAAVPPFTTGLTAREQIKKMFI